MVQSTQLGSAPRSHRGGQRFDSAMLHQQKAIWYTDCLFSFNRRCIPPIACFFCTHVGKTKDSTKDSFLTARIRQMIMGIQQLNQSGCIL